MFYPQQKKFEKTKKTKKKADVLNGGYMHHDTRGSCRGGDNRIDKGGGKLRHSGPVKDNGTVL